jgi:hypothetical protein
MRRKSAQAWLERTVLAVHRRNGGAIRRLDFGCRLLDPALQLDSLDLAEVMVAVEKEFGASPFASAEPPRTWADVVQRVVDSSVDERQTRRRP